MRPVRRCRCAADRLDALARYGARTETVLAVPTGNLDDAEVAPISSLISSAMSSQPDALRRRLLGLSAAAMAPALLVPSFVAAESGYPDRPVRLIVGFPPGGPVDVVGRLAGDVLSRAFGQPFVVDNRAGAGGVIGCDLVAKAPPDGYTLGIGPISSLSIMPAAGKKLPYRVETDFTMVCLLARLSGAILASLDAPFEDLSGLIRWAKSRPGQLAYASSGVGTSSHLAAESFSQRAGIELVHVPYKGTSPAVQDLLSGQIKVLFETSLSSAAPLVAARKVKAIALTGSDRSDLLPGVKTVAEQGFPGFEVAPWMGLVGPAGLSPALVTRLHRALISGMSSSAVSNRVLALGGVPDTAGPEEFKAFVARDTERWTTLIRQARIAVE